MPARDLYSSRLFLARRRYVEQTCDVWYILSAAHGLLHPDQVVMPYDRTLIGATRAAKEKWVGRLLWQLDQAWTNWWDTTVEIHAGAAYRSFGLMEGLYDRGAHVSVPVEHLSGGAQLAYYSAERVIDLRDRAHVRSASGEG